MIRELKIVDKDGDEFILREASRAGDGLFCKIGRIRYQGVYLLPANERHLLAWLQKRAKAKKAPHA